MGISLDPQNMSLLDKCLTPPFTGFLFISRVGLVTAIGKYERPKTSCRISLGSEDFPICLRMTLRTSSSKCASEHTAALVSTCHERNLLRCIDARSDLGPKPLSLYSTCGLVDGACPVQVGPRFKKPQLTLCCRHFDTAQLVMN